MGYSPRWGRFAPLGGPRGPIGERLLDRFDRFAPLEVNLPVAEQDPVVPGSVDLRKPEALRFVEAGPVVGDLALNGVRGNVVAGELG